MRAPRLAMIAGVALVLAPAAMAGPIDTAGASQCATRGFLIDPDPKGTNLRSAPRADAPIIGHLAPRRHIDSSTTTGVEFEIVGSKDGWLLIRKGDPAEDLTLDAAHAEDGRGWVSGQLVGTSLRTAPLRAAPRRDAPLVATMKGADWGPDSVTVSAVHACVSKHVDVTVTPIGGKPVRGWTWAPCSNELTTCDGAGPAEE